MKLHDTIAALAFVAVMIAGTAEAEEETQMDGYIVTPAFPECPQDGSAYIYVVVNGVVECELRAMQDVDGIPMSDQSE